MFQWGKWGLPKVLESMSMIVLMCRSLPQTWRWMTILALKSSCLIPTLNCGRTALFATRSWSTVQAVMQLSFKSLFKKRLCLGNCEMCDRGREERFLRTLLQTLKFDLHNEQCLSLDQRFWGNLSVASVSKKKNFFKESSSNFKEMCLIVTGFKMSHQASHDQHHLRCKAWQVWLTPSHTAFPLPNGMSSMLFRDVTEHTVLQIRQCVSSACSR